MRLPIRLSYLTPIVAHSFFLQKPGEPVYAQVNRDKKRSRQYETSGPGAGGGHDPAGSAYEDQAALSCHIDPHGQGAGDSWV